MLDAGIRARNRANKFRCRNIFPITRQVDFPESFGIAQALRDQIHKILDINETAPVPH
jgi:hypothetical protein